MLNFNLDRLRYYYFRESSIFRKKNPIPDRKMRTITRPIEILSGVLVVIYIYIYIS